MSAVSNRLIPASIAASSVASISRIGVGLLTEPNPAAAHAEYGNGQAVAERPLYH
jgi:hypothetical protein